MTVPEPARPQWVFAYGLAHILANDGSPGVSGDRPVPPPRDTREGLIGMVPLRGRSLRFEIGMFQHMTHTRDAAACTREAELARVAAATSDGQQHLTHLAQAAWWAAVADRCRAGDRTVAVTDRRG